MWKSLGRRAFDSDSLFIVLFMHVDISRVKWFVVLIVDFPIRCFFLYSLSFSKHLFPHKVIGGLVVFQKMAIFGTLCVLSSRSHYWKSLPGFSIRSTSFLSFFFFYSFSPSITGCGVWIHPYLNPIFVKPKCVLEVATLCFNYILLILWDFQASSFLNIKPFVLWHPVVSFFPGCLA